MATYVNDLRLKEIATGDEAGTWGTSTNTNLELIGEAFSFGTEAITTNADTHTTTVADGSTDPGRSMYLKYTGTLDSACTITIGPNTISKMWFIENATSGSQNIIISQGSGANITIPAGDTKAVYSDGAGSGAAFVDAFASLNVVDLKVQDDLTVTDDMTVGGTLGVTGVLTGTSLDISGDIDVDGTTNLDVVDIDGAVDMASTLTVAGVLTGASLDISGDIDVDGTTNLDVVDIDGAVDMASTLGVTGVVTANAGVVVDNITIDGTQIDLSSGDLTLDVAGKILLSADDAGTVQLFDGSLHYGSISEDNSNLIIQSIIENEDILFRGDDGGSVITALTLDMSNAGAATFNSAVTSTAFGSQLATTSFLQNVLTTSVADNAGAFIRMAVSSAGNPTYSFEDDTNTGMFTSGADTLNFTTGGTQRLIINSSGAATFSGTIAGTRISLSDGVDDAGSGGSESVFNNGGTTADFRVESTGNTHMLFVDGGNDAVGIGTSTPGAYYAGAEQLVVAKASGEAGITIATANDTNGALYFADGTTGAQAYQGGIGYQHDNSKLFLVESGVATVFFGPTEYVFNETSLDRDLRVESDNFTHALFVQGSDGNVGIGGASAPAFENGNGLEIRNPTGNGAHLKLTDNASGTGATQGFDLYMFNSQAYIENYENAPTIFRNNGAEIIRIGVSETVINETSADYDFRVESNGNTHMLFVDGGNDHVNIGVNTDYGGTLNVATTDTSVNLVLASSDAGAGGGPILDFHRNSASPADNDVTGHIRFRAENSTDEAITYSEILTVSADVTNASEDSIMYIQGMKAGTVREKISMHPTETVFNDNSVDLDFRVESDANTHMLFVDGGNNKVKIGTSATLYSGGETMSVQCGSSEGIGMVTSAASKQLLGLYNAADSGTRYYVRFAVSAGGTEVGKITSDGSSITYATSSDARLKDVTGVARGLEVINELNPVAYNWKSSGQADEGLIAQEVQDIVPNAVVEGEEDEMYCMDYSKLVVHLVAGMKEQQTLIESLTARITTLEG